MRVGFLRLWDFRGYQDSGLIELGNLNVLVGENNSGKSTLIKAIFFLQRGIGGSYADVRAGRAEAAIKIGLEDVPQESHVYEVTNSPKCWVDFRIKTNDRRSGTTSQSFASEYNGTYRNLSLQMNDSEPNHFIVPLFSRRKVNEFETNVSEERVRTIDVDMRHLVSKVSRVGNPNFPLYEYYSNACKEILGFVVTVVPSPGGQQAGVYLNDGSSLPISQMGDGVPHIVHMLASLAVSKGKLFLIEEPENDLHPRALKALLDLIISSSEYNQFVISTHSNIVVTHLCGTDASRLFKISTDKSLPPSSSIKLVEKDTAERLSVLNELGYSFSDFNLWDGWLILEESSAERIIRDYLIPWFAPKLSRIRTMAAGGITKVSAAFEALHKMMLFVHLQPAYKNKAWVYVDGDEYGEDVISRLKKSYSSWPESRFGLFDEPYFENYYPAMFKERVVAVMAIEKGRAREEAKRRLLDDVVSWLDSNPGAARDELASSAAPIISVLKKIELEI